ncbi:UPF0103-domain-containing protein [Hesseltinella vesiculosa]|uniref:UPF0103-domain-containing protein n=1 Tax=Hesseltinella vesiculosa TaxID=101127 RepID=A0A1X2GAT7_9FUNG|nr:UPF0103-domain-containing protein [Hesseltinella vesiculosa]
MTTRQASHAGSWYSSSKTELNQQLNRFLNDVTEKAPGKNVCAIIGPHAGYTYSGPTAAHAYNERVFLLGPSHHVYLDGCGLSRCDRYETPLGNLTLDRTTIEELAATKEFSWMSQHVDEDEHSIEMHLPYTYKIFESKIDQIKIVPILVGAIDAEKEKKYGQLLAKYLLDPKTLFIVSSDFCHWGRRFRYTYYQDQQGARNLSPSSSTTLPIHESIRQLDHEGMAMIASLDFDAFEDYLVRTRNTICGRHPIAVLLAALQALPEKKSTLVFTNYAQSSACQTIQDSSVSYASAYVSLVNQ